MSDKTETNEVALIQVTNGTGCLLLGKRNDNGKWTLPGGHLNQGESPEEGARRELYEETGLTAESLSFLRTVEPTKPGVPRLHCFTAFATGTAHNDHDPDEECDKWEWVDVRGGLPPEIYDKLHGPEGDDNVVRQAFDLKKAESEIDSEHHDASEVAALLKHPNPVERTMALKLSSVSPSHVTTASQDPDEMVWRTALLHPLAEHATATLAASTRLHDGTPTWSRHDHLLRNPNLGQHHLHAMYSAVMADDTIDQATRHIRLDAIASHPGFAAAEEELKKHWGHDRIAGGSAVRGPADHHSDTTMPHLKHLEEAYHAHIFTAQPMEPQDADLHENGYTSPKVIYKVPVSGHDRPRRLMVKPYAEYSSPLSGWAEGTSQALYHAAGIGHVHQQSFTVPHGTGEQSVPGTAIHIEEAHQLGSPESQDLITKNPNIRHDAAKVGMMDFLTNNLDRHAGNLLVRPSGSLLAIDHAAAFKYSDLDEVSLQKKNPYKKFADNTAQNMISAWNPADHEAVIRQWPKSAHDIRTAFAHRIQIVKEPQRSRLHHGFEARARWLDAAAKNLEAGQSPFATPLAKKMPDSVHKEVLQAKPYIGSPPDIKKTAEAMKDSHIGFLGTHPETAQDGFDNFEKNIAQHPAEVKPVMGRFAGMEPKAVFKGEKNQHFLLKGYHAALSPATGWNELTSQAAYHAGGIGHLHQKSHLTMHGHDRAPGLVIHMAPNHCTVDQDSAHDGSRLEKALVNPEHMESLRRIGLMDVVTNNHDRHNSNLMLGPGGEPLAIDHGLAFLSDHDIASRRFDGYDHELPGHDNAAWNIGGKPTEETWKWWDEKKPAILKAIEDHTNHISNADYRETFLENIKDRFRKIDERRQEP